MTNTAISRRSDVVSRVEGDETLVLDLQTQTAHCLSGDVALVWGSSETSISGLTAATGLATDAVDVAVESLRGLGLVTVPSTLSRRTLMTRSAAVGGAVLAAGVVSIPLPAAARANSVSLSVSTACAAGNNFKVTIGYPSTGSGGGPFTGDIDYTVNVTYQPRGGGAAITAAFTAHTAADGKSFTSTGTVTGDPGGAAVISGGAIVYTTGTRFGLNNTSNNSLTVKVDNGVNDTISKALTGLSNC